MIDTAIGVAVGIFFYDVAKKAYEAVKWQIKITRKALKKK